ncbi:DNA translocase FtsK [Stappia sp. 22II-S9-Z10]|nr:DNA translocase FtsK [Stappia sp. 22II-S9-Z10]
MFARRAIGTLTGVVLLVLSVVLAIALATWTVSDPSLTHSTDAPVRNWMGGFGAAFADPVMQLFGIAAPLLILPLPLWGLRLVSGRPVGWTPGRIAAGLAALMLAPGFVNVFPVTEAWPLPLGLGGVIGSVHHFVWADVVGISSGTLLGFLGGVTGLLAGVALVSAIAPVRRRERPADLGFTIRRSRMEPDDYGLDDTDTYEGDAASRLAELSGAVTHGFMMLRTRLMGPALRRRSRGARANGEAGARRPAAARGAPSMRALAEDEQAPFDEAQVYRPRRPVRARAEAAAPAFEFEDEDGLYDDDFIQEGAAEAPVRQPRPAADDVLPERRQTRQAPREAAARREAREPSRDEAQAERGGGAARRMAAAAAAQAVTFARPLRGPAAKLAELPAAPGTAAAATVAAAAAGGAVAGAAVAAGAAARQRAAVSDKVSGDAGTWDEDLYDQDVHDEDRGESPGYDETDDDHPHDVAAAGGAAYAAPGGLEPIEEAELAEEDDRVLLDHPSDLPQRGAYAEEEGYAEEGGYDDDLDDDRSPRPAAYHAADDGYADEHDYADEEGYADDEGDYADEDDDVPAARDPRAPARYAAAADDADDDDADDYGYDEDEDDNGFDGAAQGYVEQGGFVPGDSRVTPQAGAMKPGRRIVREAQPSFLGSGEYEFPPLTLLASPPADRSDRELTEDALEANARVLEGVLADFGVKGVIINVRPGPVVTLYELEPAPGIKSSRVIGLADDIARSMSAVSARVAVIPGKNAIGIELPNTRRVTVYLRELLASADFERTKHKLPMCLGKNIGGEAVIADLARTPHMLVAGTTGSGKSVSINTMILSLLYHHKPEHCRIILIDPKMLELSVYDGIPHLLTPVVTDPKKAVTALRWAVREMEDRYRKMAKLGVRNIDGYNARLKEAGREGEPLTRLVQTGFDKHTGEAIFEEEVLDLSPMPFIVIIVDEMADLMMVAGKDIEGLIQRLAQMARAAGIHVILATQRPSVDVITGTIKANFPTRISFAVTSKIDSRTILGEMGAEQLLGMGDMLYMAGGGRIQRVHGPFVADGEVEDVVAHLKTQGTPDYLHEVLEDDEEEEDGSGGAGGASGVDAMSESEDLYDRAVALVLRDRKASTSYVQRRLSIGYNRAATLIERMEKEGVVSPANNAGKRDILVPAEGEVA